MKELNRSQRCAGNGGDAAGKDPDKRRTEKGEAMSRNYWLTTHWPPADDGDGEFGIYVPEGRHRKALEAFQVGDLALIYESATGRKLKAAREDANLPRGAMGIVALVEATSPLRARKCPRAEYANGTDIWWRYRASTRVVSRSGFVPHEEVLAALDYNPNYNFRAFGDEHSGLKRISEEQFGKLATPFLQDVADLPSPNEIDLDVAGKVGRFGGRFGGGGESEAHLHLKNFVAADPSGALGESGLRLVRREYPFCTGDRADVVLRDRIGRVVGVEIELEVGRNDWAGVLQAIKYRFMLALVEGKENPDTRSFLVAHRIHPAVRSVCMKYDVECFEIDRKRVAHRSKSRDST